MHVCKCTQPYVEMLIFHCGRYDTVADVHIFMQVLNVQMCMHILDVHMVIYILAWLFVEFPFFLSAKSSLWETGRQLSSTSPEFDWGVCGLSLPALQAVIKEALLLLDV